MASVIGATDCLSHFLGEELVVNAGHLSRDGESTSSKLSDVILESTDSRLGTRTGSAKAVAPFLK